MGESYKSDHVEKTGFFRKPSKWITCSKKQVRYKLIVNGSWLEDEHLLAIFHKN